MIFPLHCKFIGVVDKDLRKNFRPETRSISLLNT